MAQDIADSKNSDFKLTWLPKKTFEVLVTIPWSLVKSQRDKAVNEIGAEEEISGFRKGKAPKNLLLKKIEPKKLLEKTLEKLIPESYQKAMIHFGLRPILSPKIELLSSEEDKPWEIKFTSCEAPEINLNNYNEELKKALAGEKIWVPNSQAKKEEDFKKEKMLQNVLSWLSENIKAEISDLLLEKEVTHRLASLLTETQKLGITVEQYLASVGKDIETLKKEYKDQAERNLRLEFILLAVGEKEKIEVKPEEIEETILKAKNDEEKQSLTGQKYLLAGLLRQQKTLDFLTNLV